MEWLAGEHGESFAWLWRASWQGSALILAVLLAQWTFRRQLSPKWRYSLWLLVLVRLALPFTPETAFSVYNWTHVPTPVALQPAPAPHAKATPDSQAQSANPSDSRLNDLRSKLDRGAQMVPEPEPQTIARSVTPLPRQTLSTSTWLILLWAFGVLVLCLRVLVACLTLSQKLGRQKPVTDTAISALLEECRLHMHVHQTVRLVEVERLNSPALCGWWRPRLLLPAGLVRQFNRQELRFIFLHELAHVKRRDVAQNWLITALQILHWFNPLVWIAFHRLRADRELACDALALSFAREEENKHYGETILKLLQGFVQPAPLPGLVGILEDKNQLRRRILMIAQFRRTSTWSTLAVLLLITLCLGCLTDARTNKPQAANHPPPEIPATPDPGTNPANNTPVIPAPPTMLAPESKYGASIINLEPYYVGRYADPKYRNAGQAVPRGRQQMEGVPFDINGEIDFYGTSAASFSANGRKYRPEVTGLLVDQPFKQLHLLHHAMWPGADGAKLATVVLHYADGQQAEFPITYGAHVRDWFLMKYEPEETVTDPDTVIAWRGEHKEAGQYGATLRLFKTTLTNPRPDEKVLTIDIVSARSMSTYALVAATMTMSTVPRQFPRPPELAYRSHHFTEAMKLHLRTKDGQPVTNAAFSLYCQDAVSGYLMGAVKSDAKGEVIIRYPKDTLTSLSFTISAPGMVAQNASFSGPVLPAHYDAIMERGRFMSGAVVGPDGKPLANAQVRATSYTFMRNSAQAFDSMETGTDSQGRWRFDTVPENVTGLGLMVSHAQFPDTTFLTDKVDARFSGDRINIADLLNGQAVLRLSPGMLLNGKIISPEGLPIPDARVRIGSYYNPNDDTHQTDSDAAGRFSFTRVSSLNPGEFLIVRAPGYAPFRMSVSQLQTNSAVTIVKLSSPETLRLRVVDDQGAGIPGVVVHLNNWDGFPIINWETKTDSEGVAVWTNAPTGELNLAFKHPAYLAQLNISAKARIFEHKVTLVPIRRTSEK